MSRFPRLSRSLRHSLQALVLATLPLTASATMTGCCAGYEDPKESRVVVVDPDGSEYGDLVKDCFDNDAQCRVLCEKILENEGLAWPGDVQFEECRIIESAQTEVHMTYTWPEGCVSGRRPAGLEACPAHPARTAVGAWIRQTAYLEAASVPAFVTVARELEQFGAPAQLVERALTAAGDEVRHARMMVALAGRYGVELSPPRLAVPTPRSLLELCIDNVTEGCVRETFGALVATWQAHLAGDPVIRALMEIIAAEETEHAQLSADIHEWAISVLHDDGDDDGLQAVRVARASALAELIASAEQRAAEPVAPELVALAGLPDRAQALALLARLQQIISS